MAPDPTTIIASMKAIGGVLGQFQDTPLKSAVIELQGHLITLQNIAMELQGELAESQRRVRDLEGQLAAKSTDPRAGLAIHNGVWWRGNPSNQVGPDGPLCPTCLDDGKGERILQKDPSNPQYAKCHVCRNNYKAWPDVDIGPGIYGVAKRSPWLDPSY